MQDGFILGWGYDTTGDGSSNVGCGPGTTGLGSCYIFTVRTVDCT
jgi:hypothetical protein